MAELPAVAGGATLLIGSVLVFFLLYPRGGLVNPLLTSEFAQSALMMVLVLMICLGAALVIFGFPVGIAIAK
jgi:hypothetical protein